MLDVVMTARAQQAAARPPTVHVCAAGDSEDAVKSDWTYKPGIGSYTTRDTCRRQSAAMAASVTPDG